MKKIFFLILLLLFLCWGYFIQCICTRHKRKYRDVPTHNKKTFRLHKNINSVMKCAFQYSTKTKKNYHLLQKFNKIHATKAEVSTIQANQIKASNIQTNQIIENVDFNKNEKINVAIFGSTGSIGTNALNIIKECNKLNNNIFKVEALYANKNVQLLYQQAKEYLPQYLCIHDETKYSELKELIQTIPNYNPIITTGNEGMKAICQNKNISRIIIGIDSFQGIYSTIHAIKNNKIIGLANKEAIVSAGVFLKNLVTTYTKSFIVPVDSEHSAIFQCLHNNKLRNTKCLTENFSTLHQINKILLCSSGGPFQNLSLEELKNVNAEKALQHPKWKMGKKITIDSSTMMNKGLEVIEAHFLFDIPFENIEIVVHKECIIHSAVEFIDKSVISQLYYPDMKIPILYALTWPHRVKTNLKPLNLFDISSLTFNKPSLQHFPCIQLAYDAGKKGNFYPTVLNAANETANNLFMNGHIRYFDISNIIKETMNQFQPQQMANNSDDLMQQIKTVHDWAKQKAHQLFVKGDEFK